LAGAATQTFAPGGKHLRAASVGRTTVVRPMQKSIR